MISSEAQLKREKIPKKRPLVEPHFYQYPSKVLSTTHFSFHILHRLLQASISIDRFFIFRDFKQ